MELLYNTQYSQPLSALLRGQLINLGLSTKFPISEPLLMLLLLMFWNFQPSQIFIALSRRWITSSLVTLPDEQAHIVFFPPSTSQKYAPPPD